MVAAMAMLGMGLQPAELLPERPQPCWGGEGWAAAKQPDPVAGAQGEGVAVPAITAARRVGGTPLIEQGLECPGLSGPCTCGEGLIEPRTGSTEIMQMELPEAGPAWIVPADGRG